MRLNSKLLCLAAAAALAACSSAPAASGGATTASPATAPSAGTAASETSSTAASGGARTVSQTQAQRGRNVFLASCTACHASGEFSDAAFKGRWENRTAADLFNIMSATMPEDAPNSLPPEQYVEIVAYILSLNGYETSSDLAPWDPGALADVTLTSLSGS